MNAIELRTKRNAIVQEMHDLTTGTSYNEEAQTRWAAKDKEQEALRVQIESVEKTDKLTAEMGASRTGHKETNQPGSTGKATRRVDHLTEVRASQDYEDQFDTMVRSAGKTIGPVLEEVRNYSGLEALVGGATGEYLVPVGFQKELETKLKAYGGMRQVCRIINTSTGQPLQWPTVDDTQNTGEWLAEEAGIGQANPTFNRVTFTSNVASSKQVLVSIQLLQDSAFDVQSMLSDQMGIRLGRRINNGYTVGDGSGKPNGIVGAVAAYNGGSQVHTAVGANATNNTGATAQNSINLIDDLDTLITGLDPAYRPGAKFMAHQSTLDTFRKQKDGFGRPLWEVSVSEDEPDTIYGYGYQWNQDMDTLPATASPAYSANTVLFGEFDKYVIRDTGPVTFFVFQETFMSNLQKGYQAFLRTDGQLLQGAAFTLLQNAA